jgi:hypothetical protein
VQNQSNATVRACKHTAALAHKKFYEQMCSTCEHISCHTDKNRYYT